MPNDPRHSRFVAIKGHAGTLVINTHVDQPDTMKCDDPQITIRTERDGDYIFAYADCETCGSPHAKSHGRNHEEVVEQLRDKIE